MGILDSLRNLTRPYDDDDEYYDDDDFAPEQAQRAEPPRAPERQTRQSAPARQSSSQQGAYQQGSYPPGYGQSGYNQSGYGAPAQQQPAQTHETKRGNAMHVREVVNIGGAAGGMALVLVKPERFEQAAEIADHIRDRHAVVMNLESAQKDIARRLIDFLSGVAYAQDGKIKKAANATYIITPYNVDLMGDLMDELESGGLYF